MQRASMFELQTCGRGHWFCFNFQLQIQTANATNGQRHYLKKGKHWIVTKFFLPYWFPSERSWKTWHVIILRCFPYFHIYLQHPSTTLNFRQGSLWILTSCFLTFSVFRGTLCGCVLSAWSNTKRQAVEEKNEEGTANYVQIIGTAAYAKTIAKSVPACSVEKHSTILAQDSSMIVTIALVSVIAHNNMWRWLHYLKILLHGLRMRVSTIDIAISMALWASVAISCDWGFQNGVKKTSCKMPKMPDTTLKHPNRIPSASEKLSEFVTSSEEAPSWEYLHWPKHSQPMSRQESCTSQWLPVIQQKPTALVHAIKKNHAIWRQNCSASSWEPLTWLGEMKCTVLRATVLSEHKLREIVQM